MADQLQGNQDAIDQRDYENKRAELVNAIEDAKQYGNKQAIASYTEALKVLEQVRKAKIADAREAAKKSTETKTQTSTNTTPAKSSSSTTINLQSATGNKSVELSGDQNSVDQLLDLLADYGLRSQ
jgi:hypothetical protein